MRTNKRLKPAILLLLVLATSCLLTGCGAKFDASAYIKACLDANTHGEFAEYAKITNMEEAEIEKSYNDLIDKEINYLSAYNLSEEKTADFKQLFIDIYKAFKYEVGEANKNEDGSYTVPVTVYKLQVFKDLMAEGDAYITDYYQKETEAGNTPSTEDLYPVIADFMYDYMAANLEALEYDEPVTTKVTVAPTSENSKIYAVEPKELQNLLNSMIDLENTKK